MPVMEPAEHKNIQSLAVTVNDDRERNAQVKIIIAEDMPFVSVKNMIEDKIWRVKFFLCLAMFHLFIMLFGRSLFMGGFRLPDSLGRYQNQE